MKTRVEKPKKYQGIIAMAYFIVVLVYFLNVGRWGLDRESRSWIFRGITLAFVALFILFRTGYEVSRDREGLYKGEKIKLILTQVLLLAYPLCFYLILGLPSLRLYRGLVFFLALLGLVLILIYQYFVFTVRLPQRVRDLSVDRLYRNSKILCPISLASTILVWFMT